MWFMRLLNISGGYFVFDSLSFYLMLLVIFLGVYRYLSFFGSLGFGTCVYLFLSLLFSVLCFCVNHSIFFWCFYELSMLPLLYLIFKDSPYSERFLAGWYFSAYLLVTSLPLVLILFYLSFIKGSFFFSDWRDSCGVSFIVYMLLSFVFFTKVPLVPFHTWLPIVHAEASSIVSIFLRGYIMKLGLLGVYRCSYFIFDCRFILYLFVCCLASIFFLMIASKELDGKRWLAFLSLGHIVVPFLGFFVCDWSRIGVSFMYCFGHGLSAGAVFGLLWYFYDASKSRNWLLLKSSVKSKVIVVLVVIRLLTLCSFPTTIQFFSEVFLIKQCSGLWIYILFWCFYLFFGGLIPLILCGHLLVRSEYTECRVYSRYCYYYFLLYMCMWCYFGVFVV